MIRSVRNRCALGMLMLGKYKTYDNVLKKVGCRTFFYVKKSKENQKFCDRLCQKKFNDYVKGKLDL